MDTALLANTILFEGISEEEIKVLLPCLGAREKRYHKGEVVMHAGEITTTMGLVIEGGVNVTVVFSRGDVSVFGYMEPGDIFSESFAAIPDKELPCDIVAVENSRILFIEMEKLLTTCHHSCEFHSRIIRNLVRMEATKVLKMGARMIHTAPKTIREKLLSYFDEQVMENGSYSFTIPFSRQQLADYLGVDRSALSNELSKMRRDGLVSFRKNEFTLNKNAAGYLRK